MRTPASSHTGDWKSIVLLLFCGIVVAGFRLGLFFIPYNRLKGLIPKPSRRVGNDYHLRRIVWAVATSARYIPRASCLTQAMATQFVAALAGIPCQIAVGVAQEDDGTFAAHAWVVNRGRVVLGGAGYDLTRFNTIATLGEDMT